MAKQRDAGIDRMRGIGIILMVLGHSGFAGSDFIYLFHMALFFMLSGYVYNPRAGESADGLRHFAVRRVTGLWLPFVVTNTVYTVLNNAFLRLHIVTDDVRVLDVAGGTVTQRVTLKDILGRTLHWCVFDGGTQLGGALWFVQALFQISVLYACVDFVLHRFLSGKASFAVQGVLSGVLLLLGWRCGLAGMNVWGLGIVCSCYCLFYLGAALRRAALPAGQPWQWCAAGLTAFAALAVLLRYGSVGLANNQYSNPLFLLVASLLGWVLIYAAAHLAGLFSPLCAALAYMGRATMPVVALHFLAFKVVTAAGLAATGGEAYLLAAFPVYFTGGAWWVGYTAAGLILPLAAHALWRVAVRRLGALRAR